MWFKLNTAGEERKLILAYEILYRKNFSRRNWKKEIFSFDKILIQ